MLLDEADRGKFHLSGLWPLPRSVRALVGMALAGMNVVAATSITASISHEHCEPPGVRALVLLA